MENIKKLLQDLGFTFSEAEVYLCLLRLGEAKVGDIIESSGVSSSNTHSCLLHLRKKRMVSVILKNNIKYFTPMPPENLLLLVQEQKEILDLQQQRLEKILPRLSVSPLTEQLHGAEVFLGVAGLKIAYLKLFETKEKNSISRFFYKMDGGTADIVHQFYSKMELGKIHVDIPSRGICSKEYSRYFTKRNSTIKIKYTDYPIPSSVNVYGNKTLIISWSKEPVAFLILSSNIARSFETFFQDLWDSDLVNDYGK